MIDGKITIHNDRVFSRETGAKNVLAINKMENCNFVLFNTVSKRYCVVHDKRLILISSVNR